jgi:hypothetical protein
MEATAKAENNKKPPSFSLMALGLLTLDTTRDEA